METLQNMDMLSLLDALEAICNDPKISNSIAAVARKATDARTRFAVLAVMQDFGEGYQGFMDLSEGNSNPEERDIVKDFVYWRQMIIQDRDEQHAPDVAKSAPIVPNNTSCAIGVMFTPFDTENFQTQVQGQCTLLFHREGEDGFEGSITGQATVNIDENHNITTQPLIGAQLTYVLQNFFQKAFQLQEFRQALVGVTVNPKQTARGRVFFARPLPTAQLAEGVQAVFARYLGGHLQLVVQGQFQATKMGDEPVQFDRQIGLGLNWQF